MKIESTKMSVVIIGARDVAKSSYMGGYNLCVRPN